jgi:hypothetical protein
MFVYNFQHVLNRALGDRQEFASNPTLFPDFKFNHG